MTLGAATDLLLAALLAGTCLYCAMLNRRLRALKEGQAALEEAIATFDAATRRASDTFARLEESGLADGRELDRTMRKAGALASELSVMVGAGENIAARIEKAMAEVRAAGARTASRERGER